MPAELRPMLGGCQDAVCEGATGSAELIGSQLTLRSSSQISQAIDGDAEDVNDMSGHGQGDAQAAPLDVMDICCICRGPTGETDIICEQCSAGAHVP